MTFYDFLSWKADVNVSSKSNNQKLRIFLFTSWKPMMKRAGSWSGAISGSGTQWYGSADPERFQNVTETQLMPCGYRNLRDCLLLGDFLHLCICHVSLGLALTWILWLPVAIPICAYCPPAMAWSWYTSRGFHMQRCGTVTIFYGSGSDFWKVSVPVPVPTFDTLRFRFRIRI